MIYSAREAYCLLTRKASRLESACSASAVDVTILPPGASCLALTKIKQAQALRSSHPTILSPIYTNLKIGRRQRQL